MSKNLILVLLFISAFLVVSTVQAQRSEDYTVKLKGRDLSIKRDKVVEVVRSFKADGAKRPRPRQGNGEQRLSRYDISNLAKQYGFN